MTAFSLCQSPLSLLVDTCIADDEDQRRDDTGADKTEFQSVAEDVTGRVFASVEIRSHCLGS